MDRTKPPAAPECADARLAHVVVIEYGCVLCQSWHRTGDPLFAPHMHRQAKHAYREIHVDDAIAEAFKKGQ
jgi:hypothetical protein